MITDNSYDYLRGAIDAFGMLDDISRRALFEELRGMLSTVCEIQKSNEAFKKEHYNYYALLEDAIVPLQNEIQWLYSEKARLEAEVKELQKALAHRPVPISVTSAERQHYQNTD